jgi:hypothetical protein
MWCVRSVQEIVCGLSGIPVISMKILVVVCDV